MNPAPHDAPIDVEPWPSEGPLLALNIIVALGVWILLFVTIIGGVYAVMLGVFFFVVHLILVGHVRGSAVKLGPNQFPEIYEAVDRMAKRMGISPTPETFIMQAGGALNAFATRFLRADIVVLFSDLLVACGNNTAARDMIIAHELGHIKSGHTRFQWFLMPAMAVPFLFPAYSRAREYTCDRFGLAGAGDKDGATLGMAILAAGAEHGPRVNRAELVNQRDAVTRSGFMTLAEWFGSHPPLSKRLAQLDPSLAANSRTSNAGRLKAMSVVLAIPLAFGIAGYGVATSDMAKEFRKAMQAAQTGRPAAAEAESTYTAPPDAADRAAADITALVAFIEHERARSGLPWNGTELRNRFRAAYPRAEIPRDPFDDEYYGYDQRGGQYQLWSVGADGASWTDDDIRYDSRVGKVVTKAPPNSLLPRQR